MRSASSSVVPTGAVTSFSFVIASRSGRSRLRSNCRSRLVMMPTSRPSRSTIGTPEILNRLISASASRSVASGAERDRVEDHPALGPLHAIDFGRLAVDRHVLVDHADAAGARHRDRHLALGHGVHRRRDERDVQRNAAREARRGVDVLRVGDRMARHEQDVVERQRRVDAHAIGPATGPSMRDGPLAGFAGEAGRDGGRVVVAMAKCRRPPSQSKGRLSASNRP